MQQIKKNESVAGLRTVPIEIFGVDGLTPNATKDGGQPQISYNGGAFINTDNTLVLLVDESYSLELSQTEIDVADLTQITVRFKAADTVPALAWAQILETTNKEILDAVELSAPQQHFAGATSAVIEGATVSGSYLDTFIDNDVSWVIQPGAGGMDVQLAFNVGIGRIAIQINLNGKMDSNPNRPADQYAYNYLTLSWDLISNVDTRMNNSNVHLDYVWFLTTEHTDPTTGDVLIAIRSTSTNTGDRLEIDKVTSLSLSEASGFSPELLAQAVWDHDVTGHEAHDTAAFYQVSAVPVISVIAAVTDESNFQLSPFQQSANSLMGMYLSLHNETNDLYYGGVVQSNDALGNIVLYEDLAVLPEVGDGVIVRNRNFDHEHDRVDVGSINGAPIAGELVPGVIQAEYTVRDNTDQIVYRDDTPTLLLVAPSSWDFTGKKVFFAAKLDLDEAAAIVDRECTVIDSRTASITLTAAETAVPDKYFGEFSQTDTDGSSNQKTIQRFGLVIRKDVRD